MSTPACLCQARPRYMVPITIQRLKADATADVNGVVNQTDNSNWETYCGLRARVQANNGREFTNREQQQGEVTQRLLVPWSPTAESISNMMRVVINQNQAVLNIEAVINVDQANQEIQLNCVQRQ